MKTSALRRRWTALAVPVVMASSACGAPPAPTGGATSGVTVVASFYPLAELAREVGGPRVDVRNLTSAGVEPHDLELTPDQVDAIEDADVVLFLGGGFQPALEEVVDRRRGPKLDLLDGLELERGASDDLEAEEGSGAQAGQDEAADHQPGDGSNGDEEEIIDPHFWLDPLLLAEVVDTVVSALTDADPAGAGEFEANGTRYRDELTGLDGRYAAGLATCARRDVVTTHAAYHYLARRYDLVQRPITGLSPESEPDPRRLAELSDLIAAKGLTTVFYEDLVPRDLADTLAREAGVGTAVLSPLEGLTSDEIQAGEDYFSVMAANLDALRKALACP